MLTALLGLAVHVGGVPASPPLPMVSPISFEDLVRFSDVIVVGTVERIETTNWKGWKLRERAQGGIGFVRQPLPDQVPFAEVAVSRVLKGDPETNRFTFLATGTWTCDTTSATVGERALFFLAKADHNELYDDELRGWLGERFPAIPTMQVLDSGRGKMPLRALPDGEYATYWAEDVILRESFPSVDGPDPRYSFKRSASLVAFANEIATCVTAQHKTWLTAVVTDVADGSYAWDLELRWDRQVHLIIHDPSGVRERRYVLESPQAVRVAVDLGQASSIVLGKGPPARGVRSLEALGAEEPISVRILALDGACKSGSSSASARLVLDVWKILRTSFDEPACADHRADDEPWLER
jgi:hypothetical protein